MVISAGLCLGVLRTPLYAPRLNRYKCEWSDDKRDGEWSDVKVTANQVTSLNSSNKLTSLSRIRRIILTYFKHSIWPVVFVGWSNNIICFFSMELETNRNNGIYKPAVWIKNRPTLINSNQDFTQSCIMHNHHVSSGLQYVSSESKDKD